jgi:signal transduction histidine kinase
VKPHSLPLDIRGALLRGFGLLETPSRQVAAAAVVICVAIVLSFIHDQTQGYDRAIARVERDTRNVAVLLAEHASRSLGGVEQTLHAVDRLRVDVARGIYRSRDSIYIHLKTLKGSAQILTEAGWFDRYGMQVASSLHVDPPAVSLAEEEMFQAHRAAALPRLYVSASARARAGDKAGIDVSLRLETLDGAFAGVALGRVDVEQFETVYRSLDLGSGHVATLLRTDGPVLVSAQGGIATVGDVPAGARAAAPWASGDPVGTYHVNFGRSKGGRIGSYAQARGAAEGLVVDVSVTTRDALAGFLHNLVVAGLEVLFAIIVLGAGTWLIVLGLRRRERLQADLARATSRANAARAEAEKANRAKSGFLARMSHELRTPLNAVIGFGQMLELDLPRTLTAQQRGYCRDVVSSGEHLLKLVNDVLDLSGVEAGRLSLVPEQLPVEDVLGTVTEIMLPVAMKAGIRLEVKQADAPDIRADDLRLRQALINLVANAVKYSRKGGTVVLSALTLTDRVRLVVTDTGCGIPAARQAELFEPFHRLGAEYTAVEGTGLGLALAKRLVEAMGGSMGFVSTVGEGSSFWIDLPSIQRAVAPAVPERRSAAR